MFLFSIWKKLNLKLPKETNQIKEGTKVQIRSKLLPREKKQGEELIYLKDQMK